MEKREVQTLVKKDHVLGDNIYVKGRISGIGHVLLQDKSVLSYANIEIEKGCILTHKCDVNQYSEFMEIVEDLYPGLCIFDYIETKGSE